MGIDLEGLVAKISEQVGGHARRIERLEAADEERKQALSDLKAQVAEMATKADMRFDTLGSNMDRRFDDVQAGVSRLADKALDSLPPRVAAFLTYLTGLAVTAAIAAVGWAVYLLTARRGG